jgi:hypothetical protein
LEAQFHDPVEAGCKSVIGQRLKQSGMHWTVNGADAIIALRCADASSQWKPPATTVTARHQPPDRPLSEDDLHPLHN